MTGALDLDFSRRGLEEPTRMVQRKEMFTSCKYPSRAIYAVLITLAVINAQLVFVQDSCVSLRRAQEPWYGALRINDIRVSSKDIRCEHDRHSGTC